MRAQPPAYNYIKSWFASALGGGAHAKEFQKAEGLASYARLRKTVSRWPRGQAPSCARGAMCLSVTH